MIGRSIRAGLQWAWSTVKVPSIGFFQDMLELKLTEVVIDHLLRPDPDVTEKALAHEFYTTNIEQTEDALKFRASLSTDASYGRYLSRPFIEEFQHNRPECLNKLRQWSDAVVSSSILSECPLEIEKQATIAMKQTLDKAASLVASGLRKFSKDPERGYVFLREWLDELICFWPTLNSTGAAGSNYRRRSEAQSRRGTRFFTADQRYCRIACSA